MEVAVGSAASLLGKVWTTLSDGLVAAYVDSLQLGQNSEEIRDKLLHTQGLLHNAQLVSDVRHNPGLHRLLEKLSRDADQAEDLLDELHYFQIHDRLHATNHATTQTSTALHAGTALGHTLTSLLHCFSCSSSTPKVKSDAAAAAGGAPRRVTNTLGTLLHCLSCSSCTPKIKRNGGGAAAAVAGVGGGDAVAGITTNSNSATVDDNVDTLLHFDRVSMSRQIKSVLQAMQSHCDSVSNLLGTIPTNSTPVVLRRPQTVSMIIQDTLHGRRDTFEEAVDRITDTIGAATKTVSVLPIVGPGGIGKTTFLQHLYNDARTQEHFHVKVWVCVSTDFDVLKLTREIIGCIPATGGAGSSSVANETTNLDQLQRSIAERLKSKRFLIVLDDIWKCDGEDQWKTLLAPFTKGEAKGSMLLVTTRFPKVADMVKTLDPLELRGLESNAFFTFFEACIFGGDDKPEHYEYDLAGIARKIADKLKGSPLAAKTVGKLLHKDLSREHWNGVLGNHQWLEQQKDDDIMPSLKISYDFLPFDLKKSFSYCGLFPEDHEFTSSEINHFWVSTGIIDSKHQANRDYLEELVDNGFFMKKKSNYWDNIYNQMKEFDCYVMHDLMHELSRSVSAQECLNISGLDFRADATPQSVRHLSINIEDRYDANFEQEMCKLRERIYIANLRTLMIFREYEEERITKLLKDTFKEINSLRVLFIVVKSAESFPYRFSKLIHLQYLKITSSFYSDREMRLPGTLSRFYHLKFLDLDGWRGGSDLPEDFSHLENLLDFRAESELHSNIRNVGKMKHLQELKKFHVKQESMGFELSELGALTELERKLIIRGLEHVATMEEATAAKLMLKRSLKELGLHWDNSNRPTTDADIVDALRPHPNLRALTIANHGGTIGPSWLCLDIWLKSLETLILEGISWSILPPFGTLPNLKGLTLKKISGMHQFGLGCGGAPGECFMRLKEVEFYEMPELAEWVVEPNCYSFPSLEMIICIDCPRLCVMPLSEVSCTNLRRLEVSGCPKMCLLSMPHTSTLTDLVVKTGGRADPETLLSYDGKKLVVRGYGGALAYHNVDKVEEMDIDNVSHISLTHIEKFKSLTELSVGRCDGLFPEELDGSFVLRSVKSLKLDISHLSSSSSKSSSSKVLNCFPAVSVLEIVGYGNHDYEECVMQLPSSSSLQELTFSKCRGLVLVPVEKEANIGGGIQEGNSLLQSLTISDCHKLFSRWPSLGTGESADTIIYPFPASLRELDVWDEPSMKSMGLLSNLTSLTRLRLGRCSNLTVDGFNPLIAVNLTELQVCQCNTLAADMLSEVASHSHSHSHSHSQRAELLPAESYMSRLEVLSVDGIYGLLVAPICNFLAPALRTLEFDSDRRTESLTEEQEKALQLLTSLQNLGFIYCAVLGSLPQGLHRLSSLEELRVVHCPNIRSMPKEGLPLSLRKFQVLNVGSAEMKEQIEKIKRTSPDLSVDYY
ncbi:NBS-LRR disease resistance protein [Hordeum vulgare]|uniref:NB-ARC domain-containing protein n=1 Tax=Hordeum vulgare subsp. vulgare TaxID=112509 RepID=A0A8I6YF82_HORVV|nr:putative disease resistance protein RGA3 [Hordeum vulgare subsp. vulgare]KAE8773073.1 NBS-LRR disease resistance protein [Hordeum vulgare]